MHHYQPSVVFRNITIAEFRGFTKTGEFTHRTLHGYIKVQRHRRPDLSECVYTIIAPGLQDRSGEYHVELACSIFNTLLNKIPVSQHDVVSHIQRKSHSLQE